jgi:hypothetical protein
MVTSYSVLPPFFLISPPSFAYAPNPGKSSQGQPFFPRPLRSLRSLRARSSQVRPKRLLKHRTFRRTAPTVPVLPGFSAVPSVRMRLSGNGNHKSLSCNCRVTLRTV